jgi:hypothetical protein
LDEGPWDVLARKMVDGGDLGRANIGGKGKYWWEGQILVGRANIGGKGKYWWERVTNSMITVEVDPLVSAPTLPPLCKGRRIVEF